MERNTGGSSDTSLLCCDDVAAVRKAEKGPHLQILETKRIETHVFARHRQRRCASENLKRLFLHFGASMSRCSTSRVVHSARCLVSTITSPQHHRVRTGRGTRSATVFTGFPAACFQTWSSLVHRSVSLMMSFIVLHCRGRWI